MDVFRNHVKKVLLKHFYILKIGDKLFFSQNVWEFRICETTRTYNEAKRWCESYKILDYRTTAILWHFSRAAEAWQ